MRTAQTKTPGGNRASKSHTNSTSDDTPPADPAATLNPIIIARRRPESRVWAIKAMCAHCMGCTLHRLEPGYRRLIRDCASTGCPLYPHRPYVVSGRLSPAKSGSK